MRPFRFSPSLLSLVASAYALLGAGVSFLGWVLSMPRLTDWDGDGITIKANTALALIAAALGVIGLVVLPRAFVLVRWIGWFLILLGTLTLVEHVTGRNFGIDTLLFDEAAGALATSAPGRMGPPAALSFTVLGAALILLTRDTRARRAAIGLALGVLALSLLAITGYAFQAKAIYTIPRLTGIALQTASMLGALAIALIAAAPQQEPLRTLFEDSNAGALARRLLPLTLIVPLGLGWLRLSGQRLGYYDAAFGTALRSVVEVGILAAVVWWALSVLRTRDVEQTIASRKVRDSERRLTDTLESITDAFVTLDPQWRFTFVNRAAEELLGRPRAELIGQVLWDIFPEWIESPLRSAFLRAVRERVTIEVESDSPLKTGHDFQHRIFPNPDGGISVHLQDVTVRKRNEDALREADRRKDEFLATLAHELRNPLGPIRNAAQILQRPEGKAGVHTLTAGIIDRQARHMARLLDDLLDISRISRQRLELRREFADIGAIIHAAVEASQPLLTEGRHELRLDLPEEPCLVAGDPVRLTQVFTNILNNAAKYTPSGGRITLQAACQSSDIVVEVVDNGFGIAPELMPRLFEMFTQGDQAHSLAKGGLGIGLALARGIVELHGGTIEARSAGEGRGSVFTVRIPRLLGASAESTVGEALSTPSAAARHILVVDDLRDNADSLALLLSGFGHQVRVAYGGEQALELARERPPEIMFLDLGMPGVDGFEVCRSIRHEAWGRRMLIVALSGWGQARDRQRTSEAGFDHHLVKPAEASVIRDVLEAHSQGAPGSIDCTDLNVRRGSGF